MLLMSLKTLIMTVFPVKYSTNSEIIRLSKICRRLLVLIAPIYTINRKAFCFLMIFVENNHAECFLILG